MRMIDSVLFEYGWSNSTAQATAQHSRRVVPQERFGSLGERDQPTIDWFAAFYCSFRSTQLTCTMLGSTYSVQLPPCHSKASTGGEISLSCRAFTTAVCFRVNCVNLAGWSFCGFVITSGATGRGLATNRRNISRNPRMGFGSVTVVCDFKSRIASDV